MLFLLTECDVFVELANACYFQLAGVLHVMRPSFVIDHFLKSIGHSQATLHPNFLDRDRLPKSRVLLGLASRMKQPRMCCRSANSATMALNLLNANVGSMPLVKTQSWSRIKSPPTIPPMTSNRRPRFFEGKSTGRTILGANRLSNLQRFRTPASLFFGRSNMFYARASYGYKGNVWTGLPRHRK